MLGIFTYQDFIALGDNDKLRREFIKKLVNDHISSEEYRVALDAEEYYHLRNPNIMRYVRLIYNVYGRAVPDVWKPNHKVPTNWYFYFVTQAVSHLLSNGVFFQHPETKERLGEGFDRQLTKLAIEAKNGGVAYGFWNVDHLEVFTVRDFAPLYDAYTGQLMAGVRFLRGSETVYDAEREVWRSSVPMLYTLFEPDGMTEFVQRPGEDITERVAKRSYKWVRVQREDGFSYVTDGGNYPTLPVVPLYTPLRQSELVGNQGAIDAYDLMVSGLINNTDEGNFVYWVLKNCGGMSSLDDQKFIEQLRATHVAHADGDDGSSEEGHTMEAPVEGHRISLEELRMVLFTNFMGVDVQNVRASGVTATEIRAAYEPLNLKNDLFEGCVSAFVVGVLGLMGVADTPTYRRSEVKNMLEETEMVLSAAGYLDDRKVLEKLPWITVDEIDGILETREKVEAERYSAVGGTVDETEELDDDAA